MNNKNIFAENLRKYMEEAGKTRNDVCQALGLSYYTFTSWVNGSKYPRMDKVEMLANYFGITKADLIEEKTAEQKEKPTAADDGLSENVRMLIDFAKSVPEDKAEMVLRVMRSIVESD